ncbi:MAG: diguanylate cyclase, partial [Cyanobacteria bacterium J06641_5]
NLLKPEHLLRHIRAVDVMNERAICSSPEDPILAIAQKMDIHRVSCVIIVRREERILPIGIITERDIVKFQKQRIDFARVSARGVMSTPLFTVQPQDSLWSIHQRMQQLNVRRLVSAHLTGELAGIINQNQILKVLDPAEMYHVMQQMQEVIDRQTSELKELNQKLATANTELAHLSIMDELTQTVNRRQLNQFLISEWQHLGGSNKPMSLIMCDVDFFKAYNDRYGHLAGDRCLVQIARAIQEVTRKDLDLVARYGGEEFAIVLPNTGSSGAKCVSEKILSQIEELQIPHSESNIADYVTVSLGTVTAVPTPANSPNTLLQVADRLLYQSKQGGRNTYTAENLTSSLSGI